MTKEELEVIDNRILLLDMKLEGLIIPHLDDTFLGTSEESFDLLEKGIMKFKMFLNNEFDRVEFKYAIRQLQKLEEFFTLISRP